MAKKSAVEKLKGTTIKIQSGLVFTMGEEIAPDWNDLRYVLSKLYTYEYTTHLLPPNVPSEVLIGGTREQVEYLVPMILRGIDIAVDQNIIDPIADPRIIATAYIMAWYWYRHLHGPKPIYDPKRHIRKKIFQDIDLRCPSCGKEYTPPKGYKKASARCKAWLRWLPKHFKQYHNWS